MNKKKYQGGSYTGERALFMLKDAYLEGVTFYDGESPLKESDNLEIVNCTFKWKYPIWYANNIIVKDSYLDSAARSGVWYTNHIEMSNCIIDAPKTFRRGSFITLKNCRLNNAAETFWSCKNISLNNVYARGDYFMMNIDGAEISNLALDGNYFLDGAKNVVVKDSILNSKDSFWNTENVTVYDSYICGEYLGWNSKNLTFVNCTIESLQGFCYIDNLTMKNCKLINTTLAFEYVKNTDAEITTKIDSVFNPISGTISAPEIETLIVEPDLVDPAKTVISCQAVGKKEEVVEWRRDRK